MTSSSMVVGWEGEAGGVRVSSGKAWASGIMIVKEVWMGWMVSNWGFSGWPGWDYVGIISLVGVYIGSDGCSMVIVGGYSNVVFSVGNKV